MFVTGYSGAGVAMLLAMSKVFVITGIMVSGKSTVVDEPARRLL